MYLKETFIEVEREEMCFGIKENNGSNYSPIDCAQQLPFICLKNNGKYENNTELCNS